MRLTSIAVVCLTMLCAATMARAAEHDAESGDLNLSSAAALHLPTLFQAPTFHILHADFTYTALSTVPVGRLSQWSSRFSMRSYPLVSQFDPLSVAHPAFGQTGNLPVYAAGMLRRFPQAPENSSLQLRSIARSLSGRVSLNAGLRALDRANGLVAAAGLSTPFGRLSVERGESQGRGSILSMHPVTIVRLELSLR